MLRSYSVNLHSLKTSIVPLQTITTLDELVNKLPECTGNEYVEIVKHLHLDLSDFRGFDSWQSDRYTRNLVSRTDKYELILLCWEEGQDTPIHCHNEQECWVYLVEGNFNEKRYKRNSKTGEMELEHEMEMSKGKFSYMNDDMGYHSLTNINNGRTVSLHLYMNPIDRCQIYDPETKTLNWKDLHYDNLQESNK